MLVTGVPGVGKSSLLAAHVSTSERRDQAIVGSSIVKAVLAPKTVYDLDAMPEQERIGVRTEAIRRLVEMKRATVGRLLVDGHLVLRNRITGTLGSVFTDADAAFYDAVVLVDAPADVVATWRAGDERDRGQETIKSINEHLEAERAEATRIASTTGLPLLTLNAIARTQRLATLDTFLRSLAALEAV